MTAQWEKHSKRGSATVPEWKKHKAFGKNGRVAKSFCEKYASDKRACKRALDRIKRIAKQISKLENQYSKAEDSLSDMEIASIKGSTQKQEASGLCFDCLKKVFKASRPSAGQHVGNVLKILAGGGLSVIGHNFGQKAQMDANMLRIKQGYEARQDLFSLAGASVGFPLYVSGLSWADKS